jgi:hypothetical protein
MQADLSLPEAPGQELPGQPRVALDCGRRQRVVAPQVLCKVCGNAVHTRGARSSGSADSLFAQEVQQQNQRLSFLASRLGASRAVPGATALVSLDGIVSQCGEINATPLAPSAEGQCVPRHDADWTSPERVDTNI